MNEDLTLPDATGVESWSTEKQMRFEQVKYITEQAEAGLVDLTNGLGADWFTIAKTTAQYGEEGRALFIRITKLSTVPYDEKLTADKFELALKIGKIKSNFALLNICKGCNVSYNLPGDNFGKGIELEFLPADATTASYDPEADLREYGFFEYKNCYTTLEKTSAGYTPAAFSNFVMNVKYHIADKKQPRRIVRFTNNRGQSLTVDMPTLVLSSLNAFIQFTEGLGNFLFEGNIGHLRRLKRKLYEAELACRQVETMGHHDDGLFVFCNGAFVYDLNEFVETDEDGVIKLEDKSYYIPSGNRAYQNDRFLYANEKRFRHFPGQLTFKQWTTDYYAVFGKQSAIELTFAMACLFSDIVFGTLEGFPMLFLYGEGSSGKGTRMKNLQRLTGIPQDGLKISEKANTDKAKIREMAQFVNGIIGLEEYTNDIDAKAVNTLKGIWDRYGYKRAVMDSKFGTESVPINSGTITTGNEYPIDDPFIQRIIALEINVNEFDEAAKKRYNKFKDLAALGVTSVTLEVLKIRRKVEEGYKDIFRACYKEVATQMFGLEVTDRMINNNAALTAIYKIMEEDFKWPFTYDQLLAEIKSNSELQSKKRVSGAVVQQFWDTIQFLINKAIINNHNEFEVSGDELRIRITMLYPYYAESLRSQGMTAMSKPTLTDKLKNSDSFLDNPKSVRIGGDNSSGFVFSISKLKKSGTDILAVIDNADKRRRQKKNDNNAGFEKGIDTLDNKLKDDEADPF